MEWFWEIKEVSGGPHYYLKLELKDSSDSLEAIIPPLLHQDYRRNDNEWIHHHSGNHCYTKVRIESKRLWVERGWGNDAIEDDRFLLDLLHLSSCNWKWEVSGGGEGYPSIIFKDGDSLTSLMNYSRRNSSLR